jgi:hypothetical protein
MGEFAVPHFMQNFAGLGVAIIVHRLCLKRAEDLQRAAGKFRVDECVLQ